MLLKTLVENTATSKDFCSEHGLSLYIETKKDKILFDVGASSLFLENAKKLDVNISDVNYLIISHGHSDHGGGLETFLQQNTKAKIFIHQEGFVPHFALHGKSEMKFIGLNPALKDHPQVVLTSNSFKISDTLEVFSQVEQKLALPQSNKTLLMQKEENFLPDTFLHEQNLIVEEEGKSLLLTGCSHNGIINILQHFQKLKGYLPHWVIGGFHLSSPSGGMEKIENIQNLATFLLETKVKYYTGHCTGLEPYKHLKKIMGDTIDYISSGDQIHL